MSVSSNGEAKAFASQLIRAEKDFAATHEGDGIWIFIVRETNEPNRWEAT